MSLDGSAISLSDIVRRFQVAVCWIRDDVGSPLQGQSVSDGRSRLTDPAFAGSVSPYRFSLINSRYAIWSSYIRW